MKKDLRRLILDERKCKTAAEERNIIEKEKSIIRASISNIKTSDKHKCQNVSMIILMDMLGHDTSFAYFECIKLANSSNFTEKRVGYLGIQCLLSKSPEIILMCTCSMKKDLSNPIPQVVAIALVTIGTLSNPDMLMALCPDIVANFKHKEHFIKCKAIGASMALIRACPETIPDILKHISESFMESASVVFRSVVVLFTEILQIDPHYKDQLFFYLHIVSNFLFRVYQQKSAENTVIDPMAQAYCLKFLCFYAESISSGPEKQLLEISKTIGLPTRACIKYQISEVFIKSRNPVLSRIGNNLLQTFLNNPSSNLKYCGLKICNRVADWDPSKVLVNFDLLPHLSDPNTVVRRLALDLSFKLINNSNVQQVLKSYLNCLMSVDSDLHQTIIEKISDALDVYEVPPVWQFDTVIRVAILSTEIPEQMVFNCISLIRKTSDMQEYSTKKLFYAVNSGFRQESLVYLAFWAIGEFPEKIEVQELEKFLDVVVLEKFGVNVLMVLANMLFKVGCAVLDLRGVAVYGLNQISFFDNIELQQRSCEYLVILRELPQCFQKTNATEIVIGSNGQTHDDLEGERITES